jgi:hypothetical protein
MTVSFPQFRKNISGTSYYKITAANHMIEWQKMGSHMLRHELNAAILPERLLVEDILSCSQGHYEIVSEIEFHSVIG